MLEKPEGLGLAEVEISDPDPDWWRDGRAYTFPTAGNDEVVIRAAKSAECLLVVDFISPLTGWIVLNAPLPVCPDGKAIVKVQWNATYLAMSINGQVAVEGDPSKRIPIADGSERVADVLGRDWLQARLIEIASGADVEPHPFVSFYQRHSNLEPASQHGSLERGTFDLMGETLTHAAKIGGFDNLVRRLRDPEEFRDTITECFAANLLSTISGRAKFNSPATMTGARNPDIAWERNGDGASPPVLVEVKRVRDYNSARAGLPQQHWRGLRRRIDSAIQTAKLHLDVYAVFKGTPAEAGKKALLNALRHETALAHWRQVLSTPLVDVWVREAAHGLFSECRVDLPDGANPETTDVSIRCATNAADDVEAIAPNGRADCGSVLMRTRSGAAALADPRLIALDIDAPRLRIANFIHAFKAGARQLPKGGPSVLVVEIPSPTPSELSEYLSWVQREFSVGRFTRVNRLYLLWLDGTAEGFLVAGKQYMQSKPKVLVEVLDNLNAQSPLPGDDRPLPRFHGEKPDHLSVKAAQTLAAAQEPPSVQANLSGSLDEWIDE